jgi:integrase
MTVSLTQEAGQAASIRHYGTSLRGEAFRALRARFPGREVPDAWPATAATRVEVLARLGGPPFQGGSLSSRVARRTGADRLLRWLETFPGETWQQRWRACPAGGRGADWVELPLAWLAEGGGRARTRRGVLQGGLGILLCADVLRPDLDWLVSHLGGRCWRGLLAVHRDPEGFAALEAAMDPSLSGHARQKALAQITLLLIAKGGGVRDIQVGDCLELREAEAGILANAGRGRAKYYALLRELGNFPADAPPSLARIGQFTGQASVEGLVDRYALQCSSVRDVIVAYLSERQPALDYSTLDSLSRTLALYFWKNLEDHHPGIDSLRLAPEVSAAWKERLHVKVSRRRLPDGTTAEATSPREGYARLLTIVRAFYLDIAQWALDDPARWAQWAAPCPISEAEVPFRKTGARRKARMDQRTRERLPLLPALVEATSRQLAGARRRLDAVRAASPGAAFTACGQAFTKAGKTGAPASDGSATAYDSAGHRWDLALAEQRAFWGWAAVEFLRHTGCRIEEMLEVSHHSITQYTLPDTGEVIPLLQIAPSKTDEERLLVVSPELADVLSTIVSRVRDSTGMIPLVASYDCLERVWNPPMPLLFQWRFGGENRLVSKNTFRRAIDEALQVIHRPGAGETPVYTFHDFRRIFTTEAILNGMPPHIAQLILGHKDINTTMGYKAIYPQEAINGHRAFIARRRSLRPGEEYRIPTDQEWDEFLGHFERRKVALGECGRAYGTSCQHEHSCVRCSLLRPDLARRSRLAEIRDNLTARIAEAEQHGWLGEAEQLRTSLAHAEDKLAQLDQRARRATTINLGIPAFREIAGRTAALPVRNSPVRQRPVEPSTLTP